MVPKIALIHDLSGLGRCSLTAAIPVISAMGIQACPAPTAVLTNQTGYENYLCRPLPGFLTDTCRQWRKQNIHLDGIYSGFLLSPQQVEEVEQLIGEFADESTVVVVDPVFADDGRTYVTHQGEMERAMERLCRSARVLTPNLTELCLLTGADFARCRARLPETRHIEELARRLLTPPCQAVVVTGLFYENRVSNLVVTTDKCQMFSSPAVPQSFSGTGDLFASVLCGALVRGQDISSAAALATEFLHRTLEETIKNGYTDRNDGVDFEPQLPMLWKERES